MPPFVHDALIDTIPSASGSVDRSLVHKNSNDNVFLTGIRQCADDRFLCTGRLPESHPFFNDAGRTPHEDILFYTELGRQASLAVTHAFLGVSTDDAFIFEGSRATLTDGAWTAADRSLDDSVSIEITLKDVERRRNNVNRVVAEHVMTVGDRHVFHGFGAWTIQSASLFQRLRRSSTARVLSSQATVD